MLSDYQNKRNLKESPEPSAFQAIASEGPLTFVVQKHGARQLHYDFRLEMEGVLKSWAVAKGPSYKPEDKRLAVMVEDHPLDYAGFEGNIPRGQYGAGQVIVWDRGTYSPDEGEELSFGDRSRAEERMKKGLADGKLSITLWGEKLKGSWTLVKMQRNDKNWLLIKHRDEHASRDRDILAEESSVVSGLTIDDLKAGHIPSQNDTVVSRPSEVDGAVKEAFPARLAPMLASLAQGPFSNEKWLFEPKLDGFRTLALLNKGKLRLRSRRGIDVTGRYPTLVKSLEGQPASQIVLDGEIVALDSKGKLCFQCLQSYLKSIKKIRTIEIEPPSAIIYYVFDILFLDGYDLRGAVLSQRKRLLHYVLDTDANVRLVDHFATDGLTVYRAAIENGLEGIVAKRKDSLYETGKRSNNWLKVKAVNSDEFVVGGYTQGSGNREKTFGALLLGYYDDENRLLYAGNVGSGFNNDTLVGLRKQLDNMSTTHSPFEMIPEQTAGVTWLKPELVVEVRFSEWTRDGHLRAPVFLKIREDKPAAAVHTVRVIKTAIQILNGGDSTHVDDVLDQLKKPKDSFIMEVAAWRISLGNLDKPLWPAHKDVRPLTKRDLLIYLARVSPWLLIHLKDRPLTLSRYPNGIHGQHFFQKHYQPLPDFVETVSLSSHDSPGQIYLLCNNLATLLWLGQIADIELHTWFSRVAPGHDFMGKAVKDENADYYASHPDFIIFDIDPYIYSGREKPGEEPELNRAAFKKTCNVARQLKEVLDSLSFSSFVKTSGRTGLHVFLPIMRQLDFHASHSAAKTLCSFLLQQHPAEITTDWAVEKRTNKVFLDYNQNVRGKTLASIYSPRPSPEASVSVPLRWDELDGVYPTDFTIQTVPQRLAETGDLWSHIFEAKVDFMKLMSFKGKE